MDVGVLKEPSSPSLWDRRNVRWSFTLPESSWSFYLRVTQPIQNHVTLTPNHEAPEEPSSPAGEACFCRIITVEGWIPSSFRRCSSSCVSFCSAATWTTKVPAPQQRPTRLWRPGWNNGGNSSGVQRPSRHRREDHHDTVRQNIEHEDLQLLVDHETFITLRPFM